MGCLAMHVEGRVVLVHLVEDEEIGILRRAMRAIDETAWLRLSDDPCLLGEQRGQSIALAFRRADLRHHREYVRHRGLSFRDGSLRMTAFYAMSGHFGRAASPARARYDLARHSTRMRNRMLADHGSASVTEEPAMRIKDDLPANM